MSSPYTTHHTTRHSPTRHTTRYTPTMRHSPTHHTTRYTPTMRHSPTHHTTHHMSPHTNTVNYSHHAKSPTPDSDSGDSSDSSADEYLGGYEKFLATLELSESDDEKPDNRKKHNTSAKKSKKSKNKQHNEKSPVKTHVDDPWANPKKKINMSHIDDALAQPVNETKYEDEDPAAYVDPDMWDNHQSPKPYEGLSNSSRKALLKLKELAALGGSPKARDVQDNDVQDNDADNDAQDNVPLHANRHTPTHSSAHKIRINVGTPLRDSLHASPHKHASPHASPHKHDSLHASPHKHFASPYVIKHEIPEESPYVTEENQPDTTEEYDNFKYNENHPDEDPRNQSPVRRDTHGDFSMGGAHQSPRKTPSRHTPTRHTPTHHISAHNNMGRRNTPTYETYKHETPKAETLRQTPSRHTPARHTPPTIHNPEMSDVEDSPFITTESNNATEHNNETDDQSGSPVESEYTGDQQNNEDRMEANDDDEHDYVETHSPITKNYTGGFGSSFATFGGAW